MSSSVLWSDNFPSNPENQRLIGKENTACKDLKAQREYPFPGRETRSEAGGVTLGHPPLGRLCSTQSSAGRHAGSRDRGHRPTITWGGGWFRHYSSSDSMEKKLWPWSDRGSDGGESADGGRLQTGVLGTPSVKVDVGSGQEEFCPCRWGAYALFGGRWPDTEFFRLKDLILVPL